MKRGQMSITNVIMAVIVLIVYLAMLPVINEVISNASGEMDTMTEILVDLFPLMLILVIIASVVFYGRPQYPQ